MLCYFVGGTDGVPIGLGRKSMRFCQLLVTAIFVILNGELLASERIIEYLDTSKILNQINNSFTYISSRVDSMAPIETRIFDESSEGCSLIGYFDSKNFKKMSMTCAGTIAQYISEYYFDNDKLIFVLKY